MNVHDRKPPKPAGRFSRNPEQSYTLPSHYYFDPEIYRRELDTIFYKTWNYVGHISQLRDPGAFVTARVGDQNIVAVRGQDGELRAFYNVCSHRAHELLKGCGKAKLITCPYHAWTYHTDGRLRTAVGQKQVANFEAKEFSLKPVKIEEFASFVFVNLDPDARSLASQSETFASEIKHFSPEVENLKPGERRSGVFRRLRETHTNIGLCLQSYLKSARTDLEALLPLGPAIRIVKGAYAEPAELAFPDKKEVDDNFLWMAERLWSPEARAKGAWVTLGTHDTVLMERLELAARRLGVAKTDYEYAMLYGIQRGEQLRLVKNGNNVRVLVSYGVHWFPWYMRRLAERPANLLFVAKTMFK